MGNIPLFSALFSKNIKLRRPLFYALPLIGGVIVLAYWRMLNNFFFYDEFDWLIKVKNLNQEPFSIFTPIVHPPAASLTSLPISYFSPLVYIIFWVNYKIFGLEPFGYHLLNLILHIVNSYLVIYLVFLLCDNLSLGMLAGLFFAMNFAITDAVIWPGAYVDTVMFFFYTLSLITFISFLEDRRYYYYLFSILLFILAISCKGTALTLPLALYLIECHTIRSQTYSRQLLKYIPFLALCIAYLLLLHNTLFTGNFDYTQIEVTRIIINLITMPMTLLIPEAFLPANLWGLFICIVFLYLPVLILSTKDKTGISNLGIMLMAVGLLPLSMINWSFSGNPDPLTESIRHRLYLGNLGFAILLSTCFSHCLGSTSKTKKALTGLFLIVYLVFNLFWNQKIQTMWDKITDDTRKGINEFKKMLPQYPPSSMIYFINFPPHQGFGRFFFKLYFEPYDINFLIWPTALPRDIGQVKPYFYIQLNGHIYGEPEKAEKVAATSLEHFYVAQFYMLKGKNKEARIELDKATIYSPDKNIHYESAISYLKLGFKDKAISELKKAVIINPEYYMAYLELGHIYYETGNYDSAIANFEKDVSLNKKDFRTMEKLAEMYEYKGEAGRAREMWECALQYEDRELFRKIINVKLSNRMGRDH